MTKQELRKLYLEKRSALTDSSYKNFSVSICNNFFQAIDLSTINVIHTFLPIEKNKEPNTFIIIDRLISDFPKIKISVPRVDYKTNTLENFFFEGKEQLKKNAWNILEPTYGTATDAFAIDIVLVPLVVFDSYGHRAGYGKGYYDKFLPTCRKDCKKIGISLFNAVDKIEDVEAHDQQLDLVITPTKTYSF